MIIPNHRLARVCEHIPFCASNYVLGQCGEKTVNLVSESSSIGGKIVSKLTESQMTTDSVSLIQLPWHHLPWMLTISLKQFLHLAPRTPYSPDSDSAITPSSLLFCMLFWGTFLSYTHSTDDLIQFYALQGLPYVNDSPPNLYLQAQLLL